MPYHGIDMIQAALPTTLYRWHWWPSLRVESLLCVC